MKKGELNAYAAGLIDGEGCITISKKQTYFKRKSDGVIKNSSISYTLFVNVTTIDPIIPNYLYGLYGGSVNYVYRNRNNTQDTYIRWVIASNKARDMLKDIVPFLRLKKPQALLAIEFQQSLNRQMVRAKQRNTYGNRFLTESDINYREKVFIKMKDLKRAVVETKSVESERISDSPNPQETVRNI